MGGDSTFKIANCDIIGRTAPDVVFREIGNLFIVSFNRPSFLEQGDEGEAATQETSQKTSQKDLFRTEKAVLKIIMENPNITRKELAARLKLSEAGVRYNTDKLQAKGILRRVGGKKAGRWEVIEDHLDVSGGGVGDDE